MDSRILLSLMLLVSTGAWPQVTAAGSGAPQNEGDVTMHRPPLLAPEAYGTGMEQGRQVNALHAAFSVATAYHDNVGLSQSTPAKNDWSYWMTSTLALVRVTPRVDETFTYTPSVTVYRHTSELNNVDHGLVANAALRTSPHSTVTLREYFSKSSGVFSPAYAASLPPAGSAVAAPAGAIAPWAGQLHNTSSGDVVYQYARNRMVGASGSTTQLVYTDSSQAGGLCDANSVTGSGFYNLRLSNGVYAGATYTYATYRACSGAQQSNTETHTSDLFLGYYPGRGLSFSVSGGPQHYAATLASLPGSAQWTPAVTATALWQGNHAQLMATGSRTVTGGGALQGSFRTYEGTADARLQVSSRWRLVAEASYQAQKNVNPFAITSLSSGHVVSGLFAIGWAIGQRVDSEIRYERLHQSYGALLSNAVSPDADTASVSLSYHFERPLGR